MKKFLILPLLLVTFASVANAQWTEPTLTPPSGNVTAPLRLDSNGRLGIGTASATYPLDVVGNIRSTGSILSSIFQTNTGDLNISGSGWGMIFNIDTDANSANNYIFRGDNTEIMRLTDTGNLGLGVAAPTARLQVAGPISSTEGTFTNNELNDYLLLDPVDDSFRFFANAAERLTVLAAGNVGIGTATPADRLTVVGGNADLLNAGSAFTFRDRTDQGLYEESYGLQLMAPENIIVSIDANNNDTGNVFAVINNTSTLYGPSEDVLPSPLLLVEESGNVGIGNANPAYALDVSGDINATGCVRVDGTCLAASGGTIDGTGTANTLAMFTAATTLGNSNISESADGSIRVTTSGGYADFGPKNASWNHIYTDRPNTIFNTSIYSTTGGFSSYTPANLSLQTNGTTRMTILNSNGNVGIGTASPAQLLHVAGTAQANRLNILGTGYGLINANVTSDNTAGLSLHYPGLTAWQLGRRGSSLSFATTGGTSSDNMGTDRLTITNTGNVGIGTTAPASRLQVNTPTLGGGELRVVASDTEAGLGLYTSGHSWVAGVGAWGNNDDFTIANNTAGTEGVKFLIQPNGAVGIGTQTVTSPNLLEVNGNVRIGPSNAYLYVTNGSQGSSVSPTGIATPSLNATANSGSPAIFGVNYGASAPAIQAAAHAAAAYGLYASNSNTSGYAIWCQLGRCGGNQAWTNASDKRLKKNISTITDGLDKVLKLRGVNFQWKEGDTEAHNIGFIAQEVLEVVPEVVKQNADGYYTINESSMTAVLVEAVKELKAENDDLKARLERLEAKLK